MFHIELFFQPILEFFECSSPGCKSNDVFLVSFDSSRVALSNGIWHPWYLMIWSSYVQIGLIHGKQAAQLRTLRTFLTAAPLDASQNMTSRYHSKAIELLFWMIYGFHGILKLGQVMIKQVITMANIGFLAPLKKLVQFFDCSFLGCKINNDFLISFDSFQTNL